VIVDTHAHVVASDQTRYPLRPSGFGTDWYRELPVDAEQFAALMDETGVGRTVLVQAVGPYGSDSSYVLDAAAADPARFASVCVVDPGDDAGATLRGHVRDRGAAGVRVFGIGTGTSRPAQFIDDPGYESLWSAATDLAVPIVVAVLSDQLPRVAAMLARFPDATVALDHCGFADLAAPGPLLALARHDGLVLKVSSIVLERAERESGDPASALDVLLPAFGVERLLWGSDYPQTHDRSYADLVALARRAAAHLTSIEQECFLGANALRLWPATN
jgi:predicted TIM-barrel fold metal-dependent hydrolase